MTHRFKTIGIAFLAMFAVSAVMASAAGAASFMTEGNVTARIEASQATKHVFTIEGSKVECETATFASEGEIASPAASVLVNPTYSGCTAFGFVGATVKTEGCHYVVTPTNNVSPDTWNAHLNVLCTGTSKIVITAGTCEVTVGSQNELGKVHLTDVTTPTPKTITLLAEVAGIKATKVKDGFLCPLNGTGETTGTYTGTANVKAFHGSTQVGVTVE
jgi:hypothetical protein